MLLRQRYASKQQTFVKFLVALVTAFIMFYPILIVFLGAFKEKGQINADPFGIPNPPTLETIRQILGVSSSFWQLLYNSVTITGATILIVIVFAMAAGVGLSRIQFKGQKALFNFFVMGLLFPLTVAVLPLVLQLRNLGLAGTRAGVVISQAAFGLPLSVFIFTGFFREIPQELQDACDIDGGTLLTFFWRVIVPLSAPVVSTVTIITFVQSWNQFLLPLLVLSDQSHYTIPLGVMQFQGQFASGWNQIMAFISISLLPIAIFYFSLQKYVIEGLTSGAIKG